MKPDQQKTIFSSALALRLSPVKFAQMLCEPPHNLTPPEATPIMHLYAAELARSAPRTPAKPTRGLPPPRPSGEDFLKTVVEECIIESSPRLSIANRSAVKAYALKASKELRAGKFERVSGQFLDHCEADLEALIRGLAKGDVDVAPDPENDWMINGRTLRCAEGILNETMKRIVVGRVKRHPSIGKTLK